MTIYRLEVHPTTTPIPIAIWEQRPNGGWRCVALFKGRIYKAADDDRSLEISPTYEEALAMFNALSELKNVDSATTTEESPVGVRPYFYR